MNIHDIQSYGNEQDCPEGGQEDTAEPSTQEFQHLAFGRREDANKRDYEGETSDQKINTRKFSVPEGKRGDFQKGKRKKEEKEEEEGGRGRGREKRRRRRGEGEEKEEGGHNHLC